MNEKLNGITTAYTYNNNGNTKTKTAGAESTTYVWDTQNRLMGATIDKNGLIQQLGYEYNVAGLKTRAIVDGVETRYLLDENCQYAQVLEEYNNAGVQSRYVYGAELDLVSQTRNSATSFYLNDEHSGVRQLTDLTGLVTDQYGYDAYRNVIYSGGSTQNNYQYRGEQSDSNLGMQYLRARYYNQNLGRLTNVDPYEGNLIDPISRHRYIYGNNNPVTFHDPSGMYSGVAGSGEIGIIGIIQGILDSIQVPTIVSIGALIASASTSGMLDRLRSGGIGWKGEFISWSLPCVTSLTIAKLNSESTSGVVRGSWIIVPVEPIPGLKFSSSLGISKTPVEVVAKPQLPNNQSTSDLAGIYAAPGFSIKLPTPDSMFSASYENPPFLMGWGLGKQISSGSISQSLGVKIGLSLGLSIPLPSKGYNPLSGW